MLAESHLKEQYKSQRYYLRFHLTLERAMELNKKIYGDQKIPNGKEFKLDHPIRIAGLTEEIGCQGYDEYHLTWLLGILHDAKNDNFVAYGESIDQVLVDLRQCEAQKIKVYIDQLSYDHTKSLGQQMKESVPKIDAMDLIPCWIKIFDLYDNCKQIKDSYEGKGKEEVQGNFSHAYLCYYKSIMKHPVIAKNLQKYIKDFYAELAKELGDMKEIRKKADKLYAKLDAV